MGLCVLQNGEKACVRILLISHVNTGYDLNETYNRELFFAPGCKYNWETKH